MRSFRPISRRTSRLNDAFTLVEALIALVVLMVFAVSSTAALNLFNDRAAKNRNAEEARALVENYVAALLSSSTVPSPTAGSITVNGMAVDLVASVGGITIPQPTAAASPADPPHRRAQRHRFVRRGRHPLLARAKRRHHLRSQRRHGPGAGGFRPPVHLPEFYLLLYRHDLQGGFLMILCRAFLLPAWPVLPSPN